MFLSASIETGSVAPEELSHKVEALNLDFGKLIVVVTIQYNRTKSPLVLIRIKHKQKIYND